MTADIRRRGHPAWLFRQLSQGRFILRLFLIGLLLLVCIGCAGALQSELSSIGAGQTELAYSMASLRNAASLTPIKDEGSYSAATTADAELQRYFSLDRQKGVLVLRDGLRSLSFQANPLSSFPLQIEQAPMAGAGPGVARPKVISLYIQLMGCEAFLEHLSLQPRALSAADRVLRCMQVPAVFMQADTLDKVKETIRVRADAMGLLSTQRDAELNNADWILRLPRVRQGGPSYAWAAWSAKVPPGESPVWRIFLLADRADPGLTIFPVVRRVNTAIPPAPLAQGRESAGAFMLRTLDGLFLAILHLRYPVLIALGFLVPLLALIMRQRDVVVRRCLEPYLLLLLAQVISLLVADALMGEGLMIWVGLFYTLLRLTQLVGLLWMSQASDQRLRRLFDLNSHPWLLLLLRLELALWSLNALGLGWHIFGVFRDFPYISPA